MFEINNEWDYAENYDGNFYFEVVHKSGGGESDCSDDTKNKELSRSEDGFVKIGRACYACYAGNISFESNQPVWVTYDDPILEEIMDEVVGIFAGFGLGFVGTCCGIIFLIIGLIMALTMKDDKSSEKMMYMPPADNMLVAQQTGGQPTTTHMSQRRLWPATSRRIVGDQMEIRLIITSVISVMILLYVGYCWVNQGMQRGEDG